MAKLEQTTAAKLQEVSDNIINHCFRIAGKSEECMDDVNAILRELDYVFVYASVGVANTQKCQTTE